jgi:accessory gene regulator protein AgrB
MPYLDRFSQGSSLLDFLVCLLMFVVVVAFLLENIKFLNYIVISVCDSYNNFK